jgi:hypothetical protein
MAKMVIFPRIFAILALIAAALIFSITHLWFSLHGFESTLVLGGLLAWICILSGLTVFVLSFLNYRSRRDRRWYWPVVVSFVSFVLMRVAIYGP